MTNGLFAPPTSLQKIIALFISFSILIAPLAPAFAQASDTSTPPADTQPTTTNAPKDAAPTTDAKPTNLGEYLGASTDAAPADAPAAAPAKPEAPAAPAAMAGSSGDPAGTGEMNVANNLFKLQPDSIGGALTYEFPIQVPKGRNGMTPDLRLQYNSQQGEDVSPFGYGWSLNIPYIEKINRKGSDAIYSNDYFYSTLDGEIASTTQSTSTPIMYGAKVENGDFRKYEYRNSNSWVVTDKNGLTYKFGTSTASQVYSSATSSQIFRWLLEEIRDTNDNYINFEYYKDGSQAYPSRIVYTGATSTDGIFAVNFIREARSDTASSSRPGFMIENKYRINQIQTTVNGTWVKKYSLGYTTGDNKVRSLLNSITESGLDDASTTSTLPANYFTYQASTTNWNLQATTTWALPINDWSAARLADVNGDGLVDIVQENASGTIVDKVYLNNGAGWTDTPGWSIPVAFDTNNAVQLADVNGDGYADIIKALQTDGRTYVYLNNATTTGWTLQATSTWTFPQYLSSGSTADTGTRIADINGDGLPDVVRGYSGSPDILVAYMNTGSGWATSTTWGVPHSFNIASGNVSTGSLLIDVNGDGLADWVENFAGAYTFINTGYGWKLDHQWDLPEALSNSSGVDQGTRLVDVNGDGLPDIIRADLRIPKNVVYINTGHGWTLDAGWYAPEMFITATGADAGVRLADVDGDGVTDFLKTKGGLATSTYLANSNQTDVLSTATNDKGGRMSVSYKGTPEYKNGTTLLNPALSVPLQTVYQITLDPLVGDQTVNTYSYDGGFYYYNGPFDRKLAGFATTTMSNNFGQIQKTYYHQGTSTTSTLGEYQDDISKIGRAFRIENLASTSNVLSKTINMWDRTDLGNGRNFVKLVQSINFESNGDSTHKDTAQTSTYDSVGNPTEVANWGEVTGTDSGTFTDVGSDKASTTISYAASSTGYLYAPYRKTSFNQSLATTSSSKFYYDSSALGTITKGNLTKQDNWISGTSYASSTRTYNNYGLVTQETDPRGATTTYVYDSYNLYPATTTNALGQTTGYLYDYSAGKPKQVIDSNSRYYQTIFDGLDRVTSEIQPDLTTPTTLVTKNAYTYTTSTSTPTLIHKTSYLNAATSTDLYTYIDGFGRAVQTRKSAEDPGLYSVVDRTYNPLNLVRRESLPFFATSTAYLSYLPSASVTGSSVFQGTVAYYKLNETSGVAYDSVNGNTLTNNNSIPFVAAKLQNGADLERDNTESFSVTDASQSGLDLSGDFSISLWVNFETKTGDTLIAKFGAAGNRSYRLSTDVADTVYLDVINPNGTAGQAYWTGVTFNTGTWYHLVLTWNAATSKANLYKNSTAQTELTTTGITSLKNSAAPFEIGTALSSNYMDGVIDEVGVWNRVLTAAEVSSIYNGGIGLTYNNSPPSILGNLDTIYSYDELGRVTGISNAVGTTTSTYDDWHTITMDPRGKRKDFYKDAYGNLSQVIEHVSGTHGTTTYAYDLNKQLTNITDAAANVRNFTYDGLGRRLTAEDLHVAGDTTYGTSTYAYDDAGNLTQQVDPKLQTVNFTYDALNRPLTEDYTGASGTEVSYAYDTGTDGIGRLAAATTSDAVTNYSYNPLGQVSKEVKTLENRQYKTLFDYDRLGNIASTTYPDNTQVFNAYNTAGLLERIDQRQMGGSITNVVANFDYGPHERVTYEEMGNGVRTIKTFDPNAIYRLTNMSTFASSSASTSPSGITASTTLRAGLLSYWKFDETSGTAADATSTNTLTNNNSTTYSAAVINNGATFAKASSQSLSITDASQAGLDLTGDFSISLWTKSTSRTTEHTLAAKFGAAGNRSYRFADSTGNLTYLDVFNSADTQSTASWTVSPFSSGTWYHLVVTWNASTSKANLYINGVAQAEQTTSITNLKNSSAAFEIGSVLSTNYMDGTLDEVGVWNRALTQGEVNGLYASGNGFAYSTSTTAASSSGMLNISYTYDANGNITQISDVGSTTAARTVVYGYDDLNRLTSASTTAASSTPYTQTYTYDILGNLTGWKTGNSATSTYTYGNVQYANPHAATKIANTTLGYDNNGNATSSGAYKYSWNYRDRLLQVATGTATTTYAYDNTNQRVRQSVLGTATTTYPNKYFDRASSTSRATTTSYIWAGDTLIATIEGNGTATTTRYVSQDHLNSTNMVTDASGTVVQTMDYYPYGSERIDTTTSGDVQRGFIGQYTDDTANLSYLNARYYSSDRGQFVSQDPVFWEVGITRDGKQVLTNPQAMNSYGYAENNPILKKDSDGRCPWCLPFLIGGAVGFASQWASDVSANRAAGATGISAYAFRSSWQEYNASVATGAVVGAVATAGLIYGGIASVSGSGVEDLAGGNDINIRKAVITGAVTVATGGFFKWGAGASPASTYMQVTGRSLNSLPSVVFRNELRYEFTSEVFGSSVGIITQSIQGNNSKVNRSAVGAGVTSPIKGFSIAAAGGAAPTSWASLFTFGSTVQSTPSIIKK